jgi:hypothetical protein
MEPWASWELGRLLSRLLAALATAEITGCAAAVPAAKASRASRETHLRDEAGKGFFMETSSPYMAEMWRKRGHKTWDIFQSTPEIRA